VEHVGMVLSGCATAAMEDGTIHELRAGTVFYIPPGPPGHDSWVVGDCAVRVATLSGHGAVRKQIVAEDSIAKRPLARRLA